MSKSIVLRGGVIAIRLVEGIVNLVELSDIGFEIEVLTILSTLLKLWLVIKFNESVLLSIDGLLAIDSDTLVFLSIVLLVLLWVDILLAALVFLSSMVLSVLLQFDRRLATLVLLRS